MNRKLHEELEQHIHQKECSEINVAIIRIKIHHKDISGQPEDQRDKIIKARERFPAPTWEEIIDLLERVHLEILQCRQPYRRR